MGERERDRQTDRDREKQTDRRSYLCTQFTVQGVGGEVVVTVVVCKVLMVMVSQERRAGREPEAALGTRVLTPFV